MPYILVSPIETALPHRVDCEVDLLLLTSPHPHLFNEGYPIPSDKILSDNIKGNIVDKSGSLHSLSSQTGVVAKAARAPPKSI